MNPNQTLISSPRLSSSRAFTTASGCASGHRRPSIRPMASTRAFRYWVQSIDSVRRRRHRAGENADQRARHLDPDRADDDALDPLLRFKHRLGLDCGDLPQEGKNESQSADRADQRLADMDPGVDQVLDVGDVGFCSGEILHWCLQAFRGKLPATEAI